MQQQPDNNTLPLPLWKLLNEKRIGGEWMAKTYGNGINNRIETNDTHCYIIADCYNNVRESKKWMLEDITPEQSEVNAQYTALAVNNLDKIATSLQKLIFIADIWAEENNPSQNAKKEIAEAKKALANIS